MFNFIKTLFTAILGFAMVIHPTPKVTQSQPVKPIVQISVQPAKTIVSTHIIPQKPTNKKLVLTGSEAPFVPSAEQEFEQDKSIAQNTLDIGQLNNQVGNLNNRVTTIENNPVIQNSAPVTQPVDTTCILNGNTFNIPNGYERDANGNCVLINPVTPTQSSNTTTDTTAGSTTTSTPPAPVPSCTLTAIQNSDGSVTLTWTSQNIPENNNVYIYTSNGQASGQIIWAGPQQANQLISFNKTDVLNGSMKVPIVTDEYKWEYEIGATCIAKLIVP